MGLSDSRLNLVASFYTVKTKENEGFRQQIDGGVYSYVSVGFRCEKLVCDVCGKDMKSSLCPHYPGKAYNGSTATGTWKGNAEALEASLVYLGAQFGAQFVKSPASGEPDAGAEPACGEPSRTVSVPGQEPVIASPVTSGGASAAWQSPAPRQARDGEQSRTAGGGLEHTAQVSSLKSQDYVVRPFRVANNSEAEASHYMLETRNPKSVQREDGSAFLLGGLETREAPLYTDSKLETWDSKLAALEALLETKDRRIDELSELAEEAKTLRSDLISQILSKSQLVGLPSLFDQNSLSDLPLPRLKALLHDLNRQFDRKFPPSALTVQTPESLSKLETRNSKLETDLAPFRLRGT